MMSFRFFVVLSFLTAVLSTESCHSQSIPEYDMRYFHPCTLRHDNPISTAPPLSWDMPIEVFQTYFAIDSLCRSLPYKFTYTDVEKKLNDTLSNEEFLYFLAYAYQAIDFDPYRFFCYGHLGQYFNSAYMIPPIFLYQYLLSRSKSTEAEAKYGMVALAAGIYRIEVTSVNIDSIYLLPSNQLPRKLHCVKGRVIQSIKGTPLTSTEADPETGALGAYITYSYDLKWNTISYSSDIVGAGKRGGYTADQYGSLPTPAVGDEYIVFVQTRMETHLDSAGMPYNIFPMYGFELSGGLFRISEGTVFDVNNMFGLGRHPDADAFIEAIFSIRDKLLEN